MLVAVQKQVPIACPVGGQTELVIESVLDVQEVLSPSVLLVNFGTENMSISLIRRVDLGVSDDPAYDGYRDVEVFSGTLEPGEQHVFVPASAMVATSSYPAITHRVVVNGDTTTVENILQMLILGNAEDTSRTGLLSSRIY